MSESRQYSEYNVGSILLIRLKDFLTYDFCEFSPGPHMNMIIGPNGSGKSSIVSAIAIGLGAPLSTLGRASSLSHFVKYGKQRAVIEIRLKKNDSEVVTIKRSFRKSDNSSDWTLNGSKVSIQRIQEVTNSLNIQMSNLCQVLPQDKVYEFAKLNCSELLTETQQAVSNDEMINLQKELIALRNQDRDNTKTLESRVEDLRLLGLEVEKLAGQVKRFHEKAAHFEKIELLKQKRPWVEYSEARDLFAEKKEILEQTVKELKTAEMNLKPIQDEIREIAGRSEDSTNKAQEFTLQLENMKKHHLQLSKKSDDLESKYKDIEARIAGLQAHEKERQKNIAGLQSEIRVTQEKLDNPPPLSIQKEDLKLLDEKYQELYTKQGEIEREIESFEALKQQIQIDASRLNQKIENSHSQLAELDSARNKKLNFLKQEEPDTYRAMDWLHQNRHLFKAHVYEPVCMELSIKDARYSQIIESALSKQALTSFVFRDPDDFNLFLSKTADKTEGGMGLHINAMQIKTFLSDYNAAENIPDLRSLGFDGYLIDFLEAPEDILVALCDNQKIYLQPVALGPVPNEKVDAIGSIGKYYAAGHSYEIKRDNKNAVAAVLSRPLRPGRFFGNSSTSVQEQSIRDRMQKEITQSRSKLLENEKLLKENTLKIQKMKVKNDTLDKQIKEIQSKKSAIVNAKKEYSNLGKILSLRQDELNRLMTVKSISEQTKSLSKSKQEVIQARISQLHEFTDHFALQIDLCKKRNVLRLKQGLIDNELHNKKQTLSQMEESLSSVRAAFAKADQEYQDSKAKTKSLLAPLKSITMSESTKLAFASLPDTLLEIDELMENEASMAHFKLDIHPRVIEEHARKCKEQENLSISQSALAKRVDEERLHMMEKERMWVPKLEDLIFRVNQNFSKFLSFIKCAGEVRLYRPGLDFDQWGIQIMVKFREEEMLHLLDAERQSGGERSVSTILYLMALQELSVSPFRIVDEINQGMDPRNERLVFHLIVNTATQSNTSQYFLITPKLLLDLHYNDRMNICCVYNGEWLPEAATWKPGPLIVNE